MSTVLELQRVMADKARPTEEREAAARHILALREREADLIPDDDPAVLRLMRTVGGEEWLLYWPELANRTLPEAKQIVRLHRIIGDETKAYRERAEAEAAVMAVRRKLRGDRD